MNISMKSPSRIASEMLSADRAAELLGVSRRFLDKDRCTARQNGTPPAIPYCVLGHRTIRYRREDVLAFLDARRVG